jgi:hypothetical protein
MQTAQTSAYECLPRRSEKIALQNVACSKGSCQVVLIRAVCGEVILIERGCSIQVLHIPQLAYAPAHLCCASPRANAGLHLRAHHDFRESGHLLLLSSKHTRASCDGQNEGTTQRNLVT